VNHGSHHSQNDDDLSRAVIALSRADMALSKAEASAGRAEAMQIKCAIVTGVALLFLVGGQNCGDEYNICLNKGKIELYISGYNAIIKPVKRQV
jgi:hypothetical protein